MAQGGAPQHRIAVEKLSAPRVELTGLLAATRFSFVVQARSPAGWSAMGEAGHASTERALHAPAVPFAAPFAAPLAEGDTGVWGGGDPKARCGSLLLELPALRGGCAGDGWLELQQARVGEAGEVGSISEWRTVLPHVTSSRVRLVPPQLPAHAVAAYRVLAHNDIGASGAGPASAPLLPAHLLAAAVLPPRAQPTSSASVMISAGATGDGGVACAHGVYEVLMRRVAEGGREGASFEADEGASASWSTLLQTGAAGAPLPLEVGGVRCAAPARCAFRVRALNLSGVGYSPSSALVSMPAAPAPVGAGETLTAASPPAQTISRLELFVDPPLAPPHAESGAAFCAGFAAAVGVPTGRLVLASVSSSGAFLLVDVHTQGDARATLGQLAAVAMTLKVAGHTLSRRFGLRLQSVSASTPSLQLLGEEGGARTIESRALGITLGILAAVMLLACCSPVVQLLLRKDHSRLYHSRLAVDEDMANSLEQQPESPCSPKGSRL